MVREGLLSAPRSKDSVDILLVNPPTPDGELWIRTQHRVGRRTRENMVWPQVSLAQMAALLHPTYTYKIIDANAERMNWPDFIKLLDRIMSAGPPERIIQNPENIARSGMPATPDIMGQLVKPVNEFRCFRYNSILKQSSCPFKITFTWGC